MTLICMWQPSSAGVSLQEKSHLPPHAALTLQDADVALQSPQHRPQVGTQSHSQTAAAAVTEWPGLHAWRARGVDKRLVWGHSDAVEPQQAGSGSSNPSDAQPPQLVSSEEDLPPPAHSLVESGLQVLGMASPAGKAALTLRAWRAYCTGQMPLHAPHAHEQQQQQQGVMYAMPEAPARPPKPQLVSAKEVRTPAHEVDERLHACIDRHQRGALTMLHGTSALFQAQLTARLHQRCSLHGRSALVMAADPAPQRPQRPTIRRLHAAHPGAHRAQRH